MSAQRPRRSYDDLVGKPQVLRRQKRPSCVLNETHSRFVETNEAASSPALYISSGRRRARPPMVNNSTSTAVSTRHSRHRSANFDGRLPVLQVRSRSNSLVASGPGAGVLLAKNECTLGSFVVAVDGQKHVETLKTYSKAMAPSRPRTVSMSTCPELSREKENRRPMLAKLWGSFRRPRASTSGSFNDDGTATSSLPALSRTQSPEPHSPTFTIDTSSPTLLTPQTSPISPTANASFQCGTLPPCLARLEERSKLRARVVCAVCHKVGFDFPRCGRCGMAWCSRNCRVGSLGKNKRHVC